MKTAKYFLMGLASCALAFFVTGCCHPPKPSVLPGIKVINMIPNSLSGETNQDSEPFLAADVTAPNRMVGTAFTPNPSGTLNNAPIYVTTDGGNTWWLNLIVPSNGQLGTGDITVATSGVPLRLYSAILRVPGDFLMNILQTNDFTASSGMMVLRQRSQVDQPFAQANTAANMDRIYVGNNDFNAASGRTATVDVSVNGGTTFNSVRIETRNTMGQNGPSIRPTISGDGTAYAAYFGWRSYNSLIATSDVVVVRDDHGAVGVNPFRDLADPSDNQPGRFVVRNITIPWSNINIPGSMLGLERIGSTLSIAVHPTNSAIVYIAWADRVGNGDIYTIHVRRSTDRGVTWSNDLRTIKNATCCALAVASNGTVGFLYQQYQKTTLNPLCASHWVTYLEQSSDAFQTVDSVALAYVPGYSPVRQFLPYIGDYNFLLCVGNEFRGIFSANNTPNLDNFPNGVKYQRNADFATGKLTDASGNLVAISIDPFYFSVRVK
jgi:hypothetical protein